MKKIYYFYIFLLLLYLLLLYLCFCWRNSISELIDIVAVYSFKDLLKLLDHIIHDIALCLE